jgi:hypothetical protein
MKKIFLALPSVILIFIFFGCSDDTTSSTEKHVVMSYVTKQVPDTLLINFFYQDTAYTFQDSSSFLQFDSVPLITYEVTATHGSGSITVYNLYDSVIFYKFFTGYAGNTFDPKDIPRKFAFKITDFTGSGSIRVVK